MIVRGVFRGHLRYKSVSLLLNGQSLLALLSSLAFGLGRRLHFLLAGSFLIFLVLLSLLVGVVFIPLALSQRGAGLLPLN
jgi:hypothetical protein